MRARTTGRLAEATAESRPETARGVARVAGRWIVPFRVDALYLDLGQCR